MMRKPAWWQKNLLLLVLTGLCACSAADNPEKLMASTEKAKDEGNLHVATDLSHRAAELRPDDFQSLREKRKHVPSSTRGIRVVTCRNTKPRHG
jgi:hypothetical protein